MNKQEYMLMKNSWAKAVNNKDNHPYKDEKYGNKIRGKIYSVHYLVYNILRMMPEERGFEPVGEGFKEAKCLLDLAIRNPEYPKKYLGYINGSNTWEMGNRMDDLLFPFNESVTIEHLQEALL